jgi:flagella basal body P-ring formation protein FlgA
LAEPGLVSVDQAAGRIPRRLIRAGEALTAPLLKEAPEITRGESVAVVVRSGAARLTLNARSESSGATGQTVWVRNPENGRRFSAQVEGKGKAVVEARNQK